MNAKFLAVIIIFLKNYVCQSKRYDNFSLYNVVPIESDHLKFLQNIETQKYIDMIFWQKPYKLYQDVQFIVNPMDKDLFIERANHFKVKADLLISDIQSAFDNQKIKRYLHLRDDTYSWDSYHDLEDIYQWLTDIAIKYPNIIEVDSIGQSVEGREILAVSINKKKRKPKVIVEGGIHGHEWISVEFVTYLIHEFVHVNKSENALLADILDKYNWYFLPILNPDGFVYSHKHDRLWRKNRRNINGVIGVDLNRNFDYNFGHYGSNNDPKDDYYCGPAPFSEPETRTVSNFIRRVNENLRFYFSFHAYGQKIILPFADRINHIENYGEMENYGKQAIMKIFRTNKTVYSVGTMYDTFGVRISGNSASWVKKEFKVQRKSISSSGLPWTENDNGDIEFINYDMKDLPQVLFTTHVSQAREQILQAIPENYAQYWTT